MAIVDPLYRMRCSTERRACRDDVPVDQLIEIATSQPFDSDGSYRARITSFSRSAMLRSWR
jgi:hypothetical protein